MIAGGLCGLECRGQGSDGMRKQGFAVLMCALHQRAHEGMRRSQRSFL